MRELATTSESGNGEAEARAVCVAGRVEVPAAAGDMRAARAGRTGSDRGAAKVARPPSEGEETLMLHIRAEKLPAPEREFRFAAPRLWRFDFAWPDRMLAVEVEGGAWNGGRHTRGSGFIRDAEKYNAAAMLGWRVLRFVTDQVRNGMAIAQVKEALK